MKKSDSSLHCSTAKSKHAILSLMYVDGHFTYSSYQDWLFILDFDSLNKRANEGKDEISVVHKLERAESALISSLILHTGMKHLTAEAKHVILCEHSPNDPTRSFTALAHEHAVHGGGDVIRRWHQQWDGTAASLERKAGTGKARILSREQVQQYVRTPILRANRAHRSIHYSAVAEQVRESTGVNVSDRTVRRYGKEELGALQMKGKKRTAEERE